MNYLCPIRGLAVAVGIAALGAASPVVAGGVDTGPVVKHRVPSAVAVPAPVPVPDEASNWYARIDAAYSFSDTSKYKAQAPFNSDPVRSESGLDQFGRYGIGVGYHFSRWLRGDVTLDTRGEVRSLGSGMIVTANGAGQFRDSVYDEMRTKNYTALANLYLDLPAWRSVTPYIGAGIGTVLHSNIGRNLTWTRQTCTGVGIGCTTGTTDTFRDARHSDFALAAAFMTGLSWEVTRNGSIDVGYRLLHLQGTTFSSPTQVSANAAKIAIPDQNIHEIRVGYRVDVN